MTLIIDDSSEEGKKKKKKAKKLQKSDGGGGVQATSSRGSGRNSGNGSASSMIVNLAEDSDQSTSCSAALKGTHSKGSGQSGLGTKGKSAPKEVKKPSKAPSSFFLSKVPRCDILFPLLSSTLCSTKTHICLHLLPSFFSLPLHLLLLSSPSSTSTMPSSTFLILYDPLHHSIFC